LQPCEFADLKLEGRERERMRERENIGAVAFPIVIRMVERM
jgi:hypothetical protein